MAKKIQVILTGDKALNRKLRRLTGAEAKKVVRAAARPALKPVLAEAKALAPVGRGALRKSIKIKAIKRSRKSFGARVTTGESLFTGQTFYGGFLEWGTKFIDALSFLKSAADSKRRQALLIYQQKIGQGITNLARKP